MHFGKTLCCCVLSDRRWENKKDLATELNISSATIAKMRKGESLSMDVLERICGYMNCDIGDIMSFGKIDREEVPRNGGK